MMSELMTIEGDGGGEVLVAVVPLTPKEEAFVRAYADPESETYGRATASAEVAKYQEPRSAAWKLRRRPRIIARIEEFEKLTRVVIGRILTDLEHERQLALAKGDIASAIRASELMGRHLAMFTDMLAVDPAPAFQYDRRVAEDTRTITALLLLREAGAVAIESLQGVAALVAGTSPASQDAPSAAPPTPRGQSIETKIEALNQVPQAPQTRQERT